MKKNNIRSKKGIKVHIFYKNLHSLDADIIGKITASEKIVTDVLQVDNEGVGRMVLPVDCGSLSIKNDGVGSIELHGNAQKANLENEGVGGINAFYLQVEDQN